MGNWVNIFNQAIYGLLGYDLKMLVAHTFSDSESSDFPLYLCICVIFVLFNLPTFQNFYVCTLVLYYIFLPARSTPAGAGIGFSPF